jgi:Nuclear transport factor 2 (NTF2) domain
MYSTYLTLYKCSFAVIVFNIHAHAKNLPCTSITDPIIFIIQQPSSMMTFEGQQYQGPEAIVNKLSAIGAVRHTVKTTDIQPTFSENALVIFVTGSIQIGGENPLHYSEIFILVSTAPQQYYVHNSIFRLNYGL